MIVVATHNGKSYLPTLLSGLKEFGTGEHSVLVLDTGSTCSESLTLLTEIQQQQWPFNLEVSSTPYQGYDSGAYVHAHRNWPSATYLFLQDSIEVKKPTWLCAFESRLTYGVGCVPWLTFPMQWNDQEQVDWVREKFKTDIWPPFGIFGPMFYARREALEDLDEAGYLDIIPTCKREQMGMERGWPTAFIRTGWGVRPIETVFDERRLKRDQYEHIKKQFAVRD